MYTFQDYLNGISRTRLIFNTDKELYRALGYSEETKNFGRIGGNNTFIKQAIICALDGIYAKQISLDLDLVSLLTDYITASEYISKCRRQKYFINNKDCFASLIEYFYLGETHQTDKQLLANLQKIKEDYVDTSDFVIPIMLLILWDIIPSFNNKKKSSDVIDILDEFERMFQKIEEVLKCSQLLRRYPIIDRKHKEFLRENEILNRLRLIYTLTEILSVFYNNSSVEKLRDAMYQIPLMSIDINGYWEDIESDDCNTIWHFESDNNCTYTVKQLLRDYNDAFYRRYEMNLFSDNGKTIAILIPSEGIKELISTGELPNDMQVGANLEEINGLNNVNEIEFYCWTDNVWFNSRRMKRVSNTSQCRKVFNQIQSISRKCDYEFVDKAFAITADHVYFKKKYSDLLYQVPRIDEFKGADINELIMIKSEEYLAVGCSVTLRYLEITTEDDMKRNGIVLVKHVI